MNVSSMTGFAHASGRQGPRGWRWELRSVNAKGLDIRLRMPPRMDGLEADVRRMIGAVIVRGSINVLLDLDGAPLAAEPRINAELALRLHNSLAAIALRKGIAPPGIEAVLGIRGVVEAPDEADAPEGGLIRSLTASFEDALVALVDARRTEGEALRAVLGERLSAMAEKAAAADAMPSRKVEAVRERLARQVAELSDAAAGLDPQRLHQEAVLLALKADIREELDRLDAHVAQGRELLQRGGSVGRRLDFLAQELSREVNTLCAKSNDVALTGLGLDLKGLVEQFREQVQNVE
jgi:uncharacterized protein (TIGR00255 family)